MVAVAAGWYNDGSFGVVLGVAEREPDHCIVQPNRQYTHARLGQWNARTPAGQYAAARLHARDATPLICH